jgi:hypothetical protein
MGKVSGLMLLGFSLSTTAPLVLATLHESVLVTAPVVALTLSMALIVYLYVRSYWGPEGLYHYTSSVSVRLGGIQFYSWFISYFLYIVYTVDYVDYMVLKIPDQVANALTLILPLVLSILVLTETSYAALLALGIAQVVMALPIPQLGWALSLALPSAVNQGLFVNILSSSLLIVCITLIPYANGDPRSSRYVMYVFLISAMLLIMGSFFKVSTIVNQLTSLSYIGLILAEYVALYNLLFIGFRIKPSRIVVPVLVVLLDAVSLINYNEFYDLTIYPSVSALYLTLLVSFAVAPIYLTRARPGSSTAVKAAYIALAAISSLIAAYGAYSVISTSSGVELYESLAAIIVPIILGVLKPLKPPNPTR